MMCFLLLSTTAPHSKATYFNERITECGNDSKAISNIIDYLLFRHKMTKLPAYSSARDLANRYATFFKEKIDKIRDELPDCSDIDHNIYPRISLPQL